jgi:hypothetical protein
MSSQHNVGRNPRGVGGRESAGNTASALMALLDSNQILK